MTTAKMPGTRVSTTPGYIVVEIDGQRTQYPLKIRAADVPALTYAEVGAIKTLSNVFFVVMKALMERDLIGDDLFDGYDLPALIQTLEDMGGDFMEPDLTVT